MTTPTENAEEKKPNNVVPFIKPEAPDPLCSFCKTPKSQCKAMVANHTGVKHICDKCATHAKKRLEEEAANGE